MTDIPQHRLAHMNPEDEPLDKYPYNHVRMQAFHHAVLKLASEHFPDHRGAFGKAFTIFGTTIRYELSMRFPEEEKMQRESAH